MRLWVTTISRRPNAEICENRKKILFRHDNAPIHKSVGAVENCNVLRFELIPHYRISKICSRRIFFLFLNLKKWIGGKKFSTNDAAEEEVVKGYFSILDMSHFSDGLKGLVKLWTKWSVTMLRN